MANETMDDDKDKKEERVTIERLYTQIKEVPELIKTGNPPKVNSRFKEIQTTALTVLQQFDARKREILKNFDRILQPIAKEALDEMTHDGEELKDDLKNALENMTHLDNEEWIERAKKWAILYTKWYDNRKITQTVLEIATDKTTQLIDKDIKVVHEYHQQSLDQISHESEEVESVKVRLKKTTEESLKALSNLKKSPSHGSIEQASAWIASISKQREMHFDQVLFKIDSIIKDVVQTQRGSTADFIEIENEIKFMENELKLLNEKAAELDEKTKPQETEFIVFCLEGLKDHLAEEMDVTYAPEELKAKVDRIQQAIEGMIIRLTDLG